ncbi:hypothetical protein ACGYLI_09605 [Sulfitobacter sp. 1A13421]|uniref:hypothetical protein n=1 Tax=Sulfitobacter sp. 1A13421 TaxID=3368595 RepID=UPI003745DDEF
MTLSGGDAEPITVFGYEVLSEDGMPEPVTLVDENGIPLSAEEVAAGVTLETSGEGASTLVLYEGQAVAHLLGVTPTEITELSSWLTNLAGSEPSGAAKRKAGRKR